MKAIKILSTLAIAALALVGCQKEAKEFAPAPTNNELSSLIKIGEQFTITATRESDETKTVLSGTEILWSPGDQITLVYGNADNYAKGVFTAQNTVPAATAEFSGTLNMVIGKAENLGGGATDAVDYLYGVFPASDAVVLLKDDNDNTMELLKVPFKADQTAVDGSFDKTAFTSCGRSSNLNLKFYNVNSVLALKVEEEGVLAIDAANIDRSLGGIGTTTQNICFFSDSDFYQRNSCDITHMVSLLPPEGQETFTKGNTYYMVVVPGTYKKGVDFTMHTGGGDKVMSITSAVTAVRSKIHNVTLKEKVQVVKVSKLWEKLSTSETNWLTAIGGNAGTDFNIAIDNENVYVTEFGGSKKIWAIDIATGQNISSVNTSTVESKGFDGSIFLSCARVVKKSDGTPVLLATNLFQDSDSDNPTGRLYVWDEGITTAPKVKVLQSWASGRRLGDTWTTYGDFEDCWMIMGTQTGNGFVTFCVPSGSTSYLISRLAIETANFCSYYPFPGDLTHGMFTWRGGEHDDGLAYRNRLMTVNSTEAAIKTEGAHTSELTKLSTWMGNYENNNGSGFNYIEFNGKRYVIWVINMADSKTFDLVIKEGSANTPWQDIINTSSASITSAGGFAFRESLVGGVATTWKQGTDCAVWNNGNEVYIAVNKINVGLAVYKMYLDWE